MMGLVKIEMLCGAEEACWAHNPKVPGSKPGSATNSMFLFHDAVLFFNTDPGIMGQHLSLALSALGNVQRVRRSLAG